MMNKKIARRHVDGPAEFDLLKEWTSRFHDGKGASDWKQAANEKADMVDAELAALKSPDLSPLDGLSDLAILVWLSRAAENLGFRTSFGRWQEGDKSGVRIEWKK